MINEPMGSMTKQVLLSAVREYKNTTGKRWSWAEEDLDAINEAENWLYQQVMPEDKDALQRRFDEIEKQIDTLKAEIDERSDRRYDLMMEIGDVRRLQEKQYGR